MIKKFFKYLKNNNIKNSQFRINLYTISFSLIIILFSMIGSMILYNESLALKLLLGAPILIGTTIATDLIKQLKDFTRSHKIIKEETIDNKEKEQEPILINKKYNKNVVLHQEKFIMNKEEKKPLTRIRKK